MDMHIPTLSAILLAKQLVSRAVESDPATKNGAPPTDLATPRVRPFLLPCTQSLIPQQFPHVTGRSAKFSNFL
jgi:hypothetical protein